MRFHPSRMVSLDDLKERIGRMIYYFRNVEPFSYNEMIDILLLGQDKPADEWETVHTSKAGDCRVQVRKEKP